MNIHHMHKSSKFIIFVNPINIHKFSSCDLSWFIFHQRYDIYPLSKWWYFVTVMSQDQYDGSWSQYRILVEGKISHQSDEFESSKWWLYVTKIISIMMKNFHNKCKFPLWRKIMKFITMMNLISKVMSFYQTDEIQLQLWYFKTD